MILSLEKMIESIEKIVEEKKVGVSFVELIDEIGEEARGEYNIEMLNCIWWRNVSKTFFEALFTCIKRGSIVPKNTNFMVYVLDGEVVPNLPLAKRPPKAGYVKPHWLPVVFDWNEENNT